MNCEGYVCESQSVNRRWVMLVATDAVSALLCWSLNVEVLLDTKVDDFQNLTSAGVVLALNIICYS